MCDFGSAMFDGDNEITPYLQSRFYRAPEVILGLKYSFPLDLWSVGAACTSCTPARWRSPGRSNNQMMKLFIEMKGPLPRKLLRKAAFREHHYDADGNFSAAERDPVTKREIRRTIRDARPTRDLAARVNAHAKNDDSLTGEERKLVAQFVDLLDKMFASIPKSASRYRRRSRTRSRRRVDVLFTTLRRKMGMIITRTRDVVHVLARDEDSII